jgi:hypothetical protein
MRLPLELVERPRIGHALNPARRLAQPARGETGSRAAVSLQEAERAHEEG